MSNEAIEPVLDNLWDQCSSHMIGGPMGLPWAQFVKSGDYAQALKLISEHLAQSPECAATKLWWVRCQLECRERTLPELGEKLQDILPQLRKMPTLHTLSAFTFLKTALSMRSEAPGRLAMALMSQAFEFCEHCKALGSEEEDLLHNFYVNEIEQEVQRARKRRETKTYVFTLQDELRVELAKNEATGADGEQMRQLARPLANRPILPQRSNGAGVSAAGAAKTDPMTQRALGQQTRLTATRRSSEARYGRGSVRGQRPRRRWSVILGILFLTFLAGLAGMFLFDLIGQVSYPGK